MGIYHLLEILLIGSFVQLMVFILCFGLGVHTVWMAWASDCNWVPIRGVLGPGAAPSIMPPICGGKGAGPPGGAGIPIPGGGGGGGIPPGPGGGGGGGGIPPGPGGGGGGGGIPPGPGGGGGGGGIPPGPGGSGGGGGTPGIPGREGCPAMNGGGGGGGIPVIIPGGRGGGGGTEPGGGGIHPIPCMGGGGGLAPNEPYCDAATIVSVPFILEVCLLIEPSDDSPGIHPRLSEHVGEIGEVIRWSSSVESATEALCVYFSTNCQIASLKYIYIEFWLAPMKNRAIHDTYIDFHRGHQVTNFYFHLEERRSTKY